MELSQVVYTLVFFLSCLTVTTVRCEEEQPAAAVATSGLELAVSQPQKRSVPELPQEDAYPLAYAVDDDDQEALDKRSSLFRFGKRGSLFRFGKRGSLFRFGKRGSLFRFGKRGSLFRFGKRDDGEEQWEPVYPDSIYISDDMGEEKRNVKSFHWGRETAEQ